MKTKLFLALSCSILFFCAASLADDSAPLVKGRLRDGTAYRTDSAGNKLSDYIAELEVTNAELRRQLTVAEEQCSERSTPPAADTLAPAPSFPPTKCPVCPFTEASIQDAVTTAVSNERTMCDHRLKIVSTETASGAAVACEQRAERRLSETQTDLNNKLAKLEEDNQALSQQLIDTQDRLAMAERREQQRASLTPPPVIATNTIRTSSAVGTTNLKQAFASDLGAIQNLIISRKSLLDTLRKKRPNISLSPQNLVTKDGTSLDSIRSQIANNAGANEMKLHQDLSEIQAILNDDIAVLTRLVNS
jgi:hypothetical protein